MHINNSTKQMPEFRCHHCGRLLGRGQVVLFQTKCGRCKTLVELTGPPLAPKPKASR